MRGWAAGSSPAGFAHERNICTRSKRPPAADGAAGALLLPLGPGPGRPARPAPAPGGPGPGRPGNCPPHPPHPARGPVRAGPAVSPVRGPGGRTALHGEGGNELVVMRAQSAPARPVGGLPIAGFYARHKAGLRVFCATTMRSVPRRHSGCSYRLVNKYGFLAVAPAPAAPARPGRGSVVRRRASQA